jgi:hypothetical protein
MTDTLDPADRDMAIRTVLGEAGNQGPLGQASVAHVIHNRMAVGMGGTTPSQVVQAPHQFESWNTGNKFDPGSKEYTAAGKIVDTVMAGGAPDPTFGATNFINKSLQQSDGRTTPQWAKGPGLVIGDHMFYNADGSTPSATGPLPNGGNALASTATPNSIKLPVAPQATPPVAAPPAGQLSQNSVMAALQGLMANRGGQGGQQSGPGLVSRALGGVGDAIGSGIGLGTRASPQSWFAPTTQQSGQAAGPASPLGSGLPGQQPISGTPAAPQSGISQQPQAQHPLIGLLQKLLGGGGGASAPGGGG